MKDFEWRLFLPVLSVEELHALGIPSNPSTVIAGAATSTPEEVNWVEAVSASLRQYAEAMNQLIDELRSSVHPDEPEEVRSDVYFVAFSHVGLKCRVRLQLVIS
jgi:hypothetical protein